ncbi:MAG: T9SS type A sorting domain-containing protein [Bacteroidota bacterium]|nr:T9SS type A sorting domain-containing protein [Bacteroidota bacterium]
MKKRTQLVIAGTMLLALASLLPSTAFAQGGHSGPSSQTLYGPQTPLTQLKQMTVAGDYVAAGVGMRNIGSGTVNITIPPGAMLTSAWMYWGIIWQGTPPANTADVNGNTVNGTLLGTSGTPCWPNALATVPQINFYGANVTGYVTTGANSLTNFPSGLTDNSFPVGNITFPLLEGATIVAVYQHPGWDYNTITIYGGAQTFSSQNITNGMGNFTAWTTGNPADQVAQATHIVADGQAVFAGAQTVFNGVVTSGPTTAIKPLDAFDGADGILTVHPQQGLWDTHTLDYSSFFPNGVATASNFGINALTDCLTWGVQVFSAKTAVNAFVDIKSGSCPNSVNINSKGMLPVTILGTPWFDVTDIDPATVEILGVGVTGNSSVEDSSTIYLGFPQDCYDCNLGGADGFYDRTFKFKMKDIVAALPNVSNGDCYLVTVTGELYDGTPFQGEDVIRIIDNSSPKGDAASPYALTLDQNAPNPFTGQTAFRYTLPDEALVRLEVFNMLGQRVATVYEGMRGAGAHVIPWSAADAALSPGSYIYRLRAGNEVLSRMLVVSR